MKTKFFGNVLGALVCLFAFVDLLFVGTWDMILFVGIPALIGAVTYGLWAYVSYPTGVDFSVE